MILNKESENPLLNQQYLNDVAKYEDNCKSSLIRNKPVIPISSKKVTIYSLISEMPYLSENKKSQLRGQQKINRVIFNRY